MIFYFPAFLTPTLKLPETVHRLIIFPSSNAAPTLSAHTHVLVFSASLYAPSLSTHCTLLS